MDSNSSCLEANPDISGLGVRLSFYIQTMALVLLAGRVLDKALESIWSLLGTSVGLTVSAIITAGKKELPLYQAIIVTNLMWLVNLAVFFALGAYGRHPRSLQHASVQYVAILQTYTSMGFILYLWAKAASFEPTSHAGRTIFIVLGIPTSATGDGRKIALVVVGTLLAGYVVVTLNFLRYHLRFLKTTLTSAFLRLFFTYDSEEDHMPPHHSDSKTAGHQHHLPQLSIDLHLNRLCSENSSWGFGQILALTVTVVPVFTTFSAFWKDGLKQKGLGSRKM
ncbi:hypothetical protein B0H14DRAFT_2753302 [Mycena olivaceomarginata]|nr:hypothetical protein B0H14DRAFT_2753302 [Mycena olivaceomarginata]